MNFLNFSFIYSGNESIDKQNFIIDINDNHNNDNILENREMCSSKCMIAWINLSYFIKKNHFYERISMRILNKTSGYFQTNTLNAIMGPSGAGKTTLMRCLSASIWNDPDNISKLFLLSRRIKTSFIVQNIFEHLLYGLTVRQTLLYASKLKNSRIIQDLDHKQIVSDLMSELLISDTADNRVESCSGGEQKRIVIASELTSCNKPNILFIDEPTSGLDSNASKVVIECLKRLSVHHNMTVITTIHQPNQDLFQMFDNIYVLAKGGVCVYSGPPKELKQYLDECQITCNQNQVPIEVLLKVCSEDINSNKICLLNEKTNEKLKNINQICFEQNMCLIYKNPNSTKRFSFSDFHYLLLRTMTYTYKSQWFVFVIQFITIQSIGITFRMFFDPNMITPDGCLELEFGGSGCNQTLEEVIEEYLINENIKYHLMLNITMACICSVVISITFCTDFKIFRSEQKNGSFSDSLNRIQFFI
jgi:ABC-type multidrug transport system ATPase subunit